MRTFLTYLMLLFAFCGSAQIIEPNFSNAEHLKGLGTGRIVEKDNTILKNITLVEVKDYWIVYLKDKSLHDMPMQSIRRLEFPESKWGVLYIEFNDNKAEISWP